MSNPTTSKIYCEDICNFMECIAKLTRSGIVFKAWTDSLIIELTGGY